MTSCASRKPVPEFIEGPAFRRAQEPALLRLSEVSKLGGRTVQGGTGIPAGLTGWKPVPPREQRASALKLMTLD